MAIELVVFDLGNVMIELRGAGPLLRLLNLEDDMGRFQKLWHDSASVRQFETGKIDFDTFATTMIKEHALTISVEEMRRAFEQIIGPEKEGLHDVLRELKAKYRLAVLSNTNAVHIARLKTYSSLLDHFDYHIYSHEVGFIKPDREIFVHTCSVTGVCPDQLVFFDDAVYNIKAAREFGMHAYCVDCPRDAARVLQELIH